MESSRKNQALVGIFVALGLVVLMASIIMFGGDRMFLHKTYPLKANFESVQGLGVGSIVSLAGIQVGNVKALKFVSKSRKLEAVLHIDAQFQDRITEGSLASVKTQGALGDKYIYIEPGPLSAAPLPAGSILESDSEGDFLDLIAEKGKDIGQAVDVIKELHILLKDINQDNRSALIMRNLTEVSGDLKLILKQIKGKSDKDNKLRQSLTHLTNILKKVDQGQGSLGALINDPSLHQKLTSLLGDSPRNRYLKPLIRQTIQNNEKLDSN